MAVSRRALVWFWASVAAATFLLGGGVSSLRALSAHGSVEDGVLLALSALGFVAAMFVAGRIALVTGRIRKATKGR